MMMTINNEKKEKKSYVDKVSSKGFLLSTRKYVIIESLSIKGLIASSNALFDLRTSRYYRQRLFVLLIISIYHNNSLSK